ncbi:Maf-like protein [Zymobacter palmae]|uniref:Nucleoside triphosphate pyrophosphatase n=2 Tax=Zymobacter palmae TaxID=33074 RepID=A0A348HGI0_9GAMM|nr:Maf-like protein [Zymobacter palmae]
MMLPNMPLSTALPPLLLASSSSARRQCLAQLGLAFQQASPDIDETPRSGEQPAALVERLACAKALALAGQHPHHLIIGSDQVCALDQQPVGKPGTLDSARRQLAACSGKRVRFHTGIAVYDGRQRRLLSAVEPFDVQFRSLTDAQIEGYLQREQPLECAGSFRMEGLGITLFTALDGRDPNALLGLPLIQLCDMLQSLGYDLLSPRYT